MQAQAKAPRAIELSAKPLAGGRLPAICVPLVGRSCEQLLDQTAAAVAKRPDILEWRVDFFEGIGNTAAVLELASRIKQIAGNMPLLFTRRAMREGGEPIALAEDQVVKLYQAVCTAGLVDLVDFEMDNQAEHVRQLRETTRAHGIGLILSFHDFARTLALPQLTQRFAQAALLGADAAKVAVMPRSKEDVLTLLAATLQASQTLDIPVVSMAMGACGAMTRLCGWLFGSAMTYAIGQSSSAPGQLPIEDIEAGIAVLRKAFVKAD